MATKAQIQSLIDTQLASGGPVIIATHRNVLKNDAASILENAYGTVIVDTELIGGYLTPVDDPNVVYKTWLVKQGRKVSISGYLIAQNTISNFADILAGEWTIPTNNTAYGDAFNLNVLGGAFNQCRVQGIAGVTRISFKDSIPPGARINFSVEYFTEN